MRTEILTKDNLFLIAVIIIAASVVFGMLRNPGKLLRKILVNSAIGFVSLFVVNYLGASFGIYIDITIWTVLLAGFLGLPGVIILVILARFPNLYQNLGVADKINEIFGLNPDQVISTAKGAADAAKGVINSVK